uniref:Transmembrane protein n=1 Tax=Medicago truncatula TaxID=3880 RepID=A2Q680_MEDTR|nr:hypothetical protein MtrDRAFT_AC173289g21v1 [Medicago truncatula]
MVVVFFVFLTKNFVPQKRKLNNFFLNILGLNVCLVPSLLLNFGFGPCTFFV